MLCPATSLSTRLGTALIFALPGGADTFTFSNFFFDESSATPANRFGYVEFADGMRMSASLLVTRLGSDNTNVASSGADSVDRDRRRRHA